MKKNDIFTFTASNGAKVTAVALDVVSSSWQDIIICYAQNRLFYFYEHRYIDGGGGTGADYSYGEVIADYAVLPGFDVILEEYQYQLDNKGLENYEKS